MGEVYKFNRENDELLTEAEKAFDLTARRQAMPAPQEPVIEEHPRMPLMQTLAGLLGLSTRH